MPELTRRRYPEAHDEYWCVYCGDVHAGRLAKRTGKPQVTASRLKFFGSVGLPEDVGDDRPVFLRLRRSVVGLPMRMKPG